jgi:sodium-dependent dicarboxylate transporter 2/3/5
LHISLDKIQLIHFFLISFLVSRLMIRHKLPERLLYWLFEEKHISISRLALIIILSTSLLSAVIANVISLLAVLPVILLLQEEYTGSDKNKRKFSTMIMLAAIWGANIGGMGMLTGTTTNGVLIGMLETFHFQESASFTFLSWLIWGLPLSLLLCVLGWLVLRMVFQPESKLSGSSIRARLQQPENSTRGQRITILLALFFIFSSALLSLAMSLLKQHGSLVYAVTVVWTLLYLWILFVPKFNLTEGTKSRLLRYQDVIHGIPARGILWMLIGVAVTVVLYFLGIPKAIATAAMNWVQADHSLLMLLIIIALVTTFATEIVSNSVIQIAMFVTLFPLSRACPQISTEIMLIITLTSTCAFMTPIATPSNGLGFGTVKNISLGYMLVAGFVMNLASAVLISLWVHYVVPIVLAWFA